MAINQGYITFNTLHGISSKSFSASSSSSQLRYYTIQEVQALWEQAFGSMNLKGRTVVEVECASLPTPEG